MAKIAVADSETDPFLFGRVPSPFVWGFFDGVKYRWFWGEKDCTDQFFNFLDTLKEPHRIYVHNGGKFDFFFTLRYVQNPIKIINGRLVQFKYGIHTIVDSWAIIPESLEAANAKTKIDYAKFEKEKRATYREEILDYLHDDCVYLYELCRAFVDEFGTRLTIGGTAMAELKKHHRTIKCGPAHDKKFRPFYFGGRVQCFEKGIIHGDFILVDRNSMYPAVMRDEKHPIGEEYEYTTSYKYALESGMPFFIEFDGICRSLPRRTKKGEVKYDGERGHFCVTGHEFRAAIELDLIERISGVHAWICCDYETYGEFIEHFNAAKIQAEILGDKIHRSFYKRIMNSGYGRFAINPEKFEDYVIRKLGEAQPYGYYPLADYGEFEIWSKPSDHGQYQDVAIGASITGAARADLMRSLAIARRPIYCDTDSILCEAFPGEQDQKRLGAWKTEMSGIKVAAIGGKKLYALFDAENECRKYASKGCRISPEQIFNACKGDEILYNQIAPTFSLTNGSTFLTRRIRAT